jgi:hypothetical protein
VTGSYHSQILASLARYVECAAEAEAAEVERAEAVWQWGVTLGADSFVMALPDWKTEQQRGTSSVELTVQNYRALKTEADVLGLSVEAHLSRLLTAAMRDDTLLSGPPGKDVQLMIDANMHRILRTER